MRPKNFPGRKRVRKIDAIKRKADKAGRPYTEDELTEIKQAQGIETKKRR